MKTNNKNNVIGAIICILLAGFLLVLMWSSGYYIFGIVVFLLLMVIAWGSIAAATKSELFYFIAKKSLAREKIGLFTDKNERTHEVTTTLKIKTKGTDILSVDSDDFESKSEDNKQE
jgi:hypothetical protein